MIPTRLTTTLILAFVSISLDTDMRDVLNLAGMLLKVKVSFA
jgi:hypothetical protein